MLACDDRLIDFHDMAAIRGMMVLVTGTSCTYSSSMYMMVPTQLNLCYTYRTVIPSEDLL